MKTLFLSFALFVFITSYGQTIDSPEEINLYREANDTRFAKVVGKILPDFTAKDLKGKTYTSNSIRGTKATFINLWFISCQPCIDEIPNLNRLYNSLKDSAGFQFFAITRESEAQVKEAIIKYGIQFPILLTTPVVAQKLGFRRGYPTNMVLDSKGNIEAILTGGGGLDLRLQVELYWKHEIEKRLKDYKPASK